MLTPPGYPAGGIQRGVVHRRHGLLIGTLAKTDEQAIIYSLVPMFVFAGIGGAWVRWKSQGRPSRPSGTCRR